MDDRDRRLVIGADDAGLGLAPYETQLDGERLVISRAGDGSLSAQRPASPDVDVQTLTERLTSRGLEIGGMEKVMPSLEDVFLDVVEHS